MASAGIRDDFVVEAGQAAAWLKEEDVNRDEDEAADKWALRGSRSGHGSRGAWDSRDTGGGGILPALPLRPTG